jgi:glycoprotein 6-alpha-L-fucosyltransferase
LGQKLRPKKIGRPKIRPSLTHDINSLSAGYTFLGDPSVALSAAVSTRYTSSSLKGILSDIHLLSKTDYLVCTFSSQVQ